MNAFSLGHVAVIHVVGLNGPLTVIRNDSTEASTAETEGDFALDYLDATICKLRPRSYVEPSAPQTAMVHGATSITASPGSVAAAVIDGPVIIDNGTVKLKSTPPARNFEAGSITISCPTGVVVLFQSCKGHYKGPDQQSGEMASGTVPIFA